MEERTIREKEEMTTVAEEVLSTLPQKEAAHVLSLSGELGAGKTTFVQALAGLLGVREHVVSPTFVIMRSYKATAHTWIRKLIHIDAYRIEEVEEMRVLRLEDLYTKRGSVICIEWPERIQNLIPEDARTISIQVNSDGTRTITYDS